MANAERDDNRIAEALAFDGTNPARLKVDPATGRLLVNVVVANNASPTVHAEPMGRDANRVPASGGVNDNAAGAVAPLHTDANGNLEVDMIQA